MNKSFNHEGSKGLRVLIADKNYYSFGIHKTDAVVVDIERDPVDGDIVVVPKGKAYTYARIKTLGESKKYRSYHPDYGYISNSSLPKVHIWGVVTQVMCNVQQGGDWK